MKNRPPIAVVGMAGLFPGAPNLDIYWQNIINKIDAICEVYEKRWIVAPNLAYNPSFLPDKAVSKKAGLIDYFQFDQKSFDLDKTILNDIDPICQMVLHTGKEAFSGCITSSLNKDRIGVILAAIILPTDLASSITSEILGSSFKEKLFRGLTPNRRNSEAGRSRLTRSACLSSRVTSFPGAVLAKELGLGGGSFTLDAACASSIYAVKLACDELYSHRADAMMAGGVSRPDSLYTQVGFSQLLALSPSGRCAPFDEKADGLVVGEGAGILVLKRLDDAVRDGDYIYGLIRGIGLSNDIKGSLIAPDIGGQVRAMQMAYKSAGWSPHEIDLIECHGAGTPVGDITELRSLTELWGKSGWSRGECPIGSVKSMIGHLLTAAGSAGMIKSLLALKHNILPPSINFSKPPKNSPLENSPFRVQTEADKWIAKDKNRPLRAAVSAFGFGGINGHLLFEQWNPEKKQTFVMTNLSAKKGGEKEKDSHDPASVAVEINADKQNLEEEKIPSIAIIGMEAVFGSLKSLRDFQKAVFKGEAAFIKRPENRWKSCDDTGRQHFGTRISYGGYMDAVSLDIGKFRIPPSEIPDILLQQLLMLKVAAGAMEDAGLDLKKERPDMGTVIGTGFDFESTNFHLRWNLPNLVKRWMEKEALKLGDDNETRDWIEILKDACSFPLTSARTLGALGGIVASRVAREFYLGGPSFVVSGEEISGLKALEIGVKFLQQNEADTFLIGAIDLACDIRNLIVLNRIRAFGKDSRIYPFDRKADGTLPGEGAAAVVLKRVDRAIKDKDRIYAVIKGIGKAGGGDFKPAKPAKEVYINSLRRAHADAKISSSSVSFVETHGSGDPLEDDMEAEALCDFFADRNGLHKKRCAIGSVKPNIGHTGAASGLASIIKTSLCLYQEIIPPLKNYTSPKNRIWHDGGFYFPAYPQYWLRDRKDGPRRACTAAMTLDGNCMHVILEGFDYSSARTSQNRLLEKVKRERKSPLGPQPFGLFVVEAAGKKELIKGLDKLYTYLKEEKNSISTGRRPDSFDIPPNKYDEYMEFAARRWYHKTGYPKFKTPANGNRKKSDADEKKHVVSIILDSFSNIKKWITEAKTSVLYDRPMQINGQEGVIYSPRPLSLLGDTAFVFPGSGNHFVGMGRQTGVLWPEIFRSMDEKTPLLETMVIPECYVPQRISWTPGWEKDANEKIVSDPLNMLLGQISFGQAVTKLVKRFAIKPSAVIGYSLGESAGFFSLGVWPDSSEMLKRMRRTDLFSTELAGVCNSAREIWNIPDSEDVNWSVAAVNSPADAVKKAIEKQPNVYLLIVNTGDESVIGGRREQVESVIKELGCAAVYLEGVVTVHCNAVLPVKEAYRNLHLFPVRPLKDIRFYSCSLGKVYDLTSENAADSILNQALYGFDFTKTVNRAYDDGIRIFLEMGPLSSCKRMIDKILDKKPHLAVSASVRAEDNYLTLLKFLGALIAEQVPVDLEKLYGSGHFNENYINFSNEKSTKKLLMTVGGRSIVPPPEAIEFIINLSASGTAPLSGFARQKKDFNLPFLVEKEADILKKTDFHKTGSSNTMISQNSGSLILSDLQRDIFLNYFLNMTETIEATSEAHGKFLDFSNDLTKAFGKTFAFQTQLLETIISDHKVSSQVAALIKDDLSDDRQHKRIYKSKMAVLTAEPPAFSRDMCMEFAVGSVARVLGPQFAVVDTYRKRVRLPDDPLMLVDRIISIKGEKCSLGSGKVVTEHDVLPGAWYLDGGRAPVCISVEAGQADLFLCAYLGIDLVVKGKRTYRLLDATVEFYRGLPTPGDTIRYEIEIEKFVHQGDTHLFFFNFQGFIGNTHLIKMKNGCAGFFTEEEMKKSGGIILTQKDKSFLEGKITSNWKELVPTFVESYDDNALEALRNGDLAGCFGNLFDGIKIAESLRLPGGRMKLIDRILLIDPRGGRYGTGIIRGETDIHPDDWFLTCHFKDDKVMPGTLMYECCAHTLRIFCQRIGWVVEKAGKCYEPVAGVKSILKCRGPVTPETEHVIYEAEIKEIGYMPEPYLIADAHIFSGGQRIVFFKDISLKITDATRKEIESVWKKREETLAETEPDDKPDDKSDGKILFDREKILAYSIGKPSEAFGKPYEPFDEKRVIARLPGPPYLFMDRITRIEPDAWDLKPGGWIEAEYDIDPEAWYFKANRQPIMPYCVILEIALQPCGWLAAYLGSALQSSNDLKFRNLGGNMVLYSDVFPDSKRLSMRTSMKQVSSAGDMIIEHFETRILREDKIIYKGNTYFGFFTEDALAKQLGIRNISDQIYIPADDEMKRSRIYKLEDIPPFSPDETGDGLEVYTDSASAMPAKALRMIDRIETYIPDGGPFGLGFIRGVKMVDPDEWFFKAHFYQDPVCPGSLGIESFLQLLRFIAIDRWPDLSEKCVFAHLTEKVHKWIYRGQVIPGNKKVEVEASVTGIQDQPVPSIQADGFLKVDGLYIYKMENFGLRLIHTPFADF